MSDQTSQSTTPDDASEQEQSIIKTQKPHVEPVQYLCSTANSTVTSLIYWENPLSSVIVLGTGLANCLLFYYYSISSIYAAVAFFVLFGNWLYVLGYKQLQHLLGREPKHPFERLLSERLFVIRQEQVEKHLDVSLQIVNSLSSEYAKIIFVEDAFRTAKYAGCVFVLWYLTTWFSVPTILGLFLVAAFTIPAGYKNHKEAIDNKYEYAKNKAKSYSQRTLKVACNNMGDCYEKSRQYLGKKIAHTGETLKKKE
ncbi:9312_t:CDS:2 [Paraglomus brasilianum]|uniref:Reticulon-like protein n=1 Tax=Paraglomus brasilianum TaxID=144538 RepID=A0A9N9CFN1_9GLOM|nr:9312_t:CDS:2 [Paraglomus brasilianum]